MGSFGQLGVGEALSIASNPLLVTKDSTIKKIYCGGTYSIFLKENGISKKIFN